MNNEVKAVSQSRGSARNFLYSKTDTGRIRDLTKKKAVGIHEVLRRFFPDLRIEKSFIEYAMQRLAAVTEFTALAIGVDQTRKEEEEYSESGAFDDHVEVAGILEMICQEKNGCWGILKPALFGCMFPEINASDGLGLARYLRNRLAEKMKPSVTIGIASYPIITFKKSDIIDNARKALEHAAFFGPGSTVAFDGVSLNISGDKLYESGNIQGAIDEFKLALLLDPSNVNVHNSLGVCYGLQGEYEAAIEEFKTAAAIDPQEYMAMFNLGLVHTLKNQPEEALECFLNADKINGDVYEVAYQSGKLYLESGALKKARPYMERAVKLDPDSGTAHRYLGECYAAENMTREAITAYKKAIRLNPHDAASMSALGCLLDGQGENPEITLMFCRESVDLSPENGLFRYRLGQLYVKQNRLDDAMAEYKKAEQFGFDVASDIQKLKNRLSAP